MLKEKFIIAFCRKTWEIWEKFGFHLSPNHFYWPIPDTKSLKKYNFNKQFPLEGINFNDSNMLSLLEKIKLYKDEYLKIKTDSAYESNGDGAILYGLVREFKPNQIIEIGSGYSTRVSSNALKKNKRGKIIAIEPYPSKMSVDLTKKKDNVILIRKKVEEMGLKFFKKLRPGDILFVDSSHIIRCGNDVHFIYLYLLPTIPVGTIVHIHDIRFPEEYPKEWLINKKYFWNEQYLLHMFLCFNNSFKILFAGNYMGNKYPKKMEECLVSFNVSTRGWPGCFWIQRIN